jgi:hypothetical protein
MDHRPTVGIVVRIENKRLQRGFRIALGRRQPMDNRLEDLRDADALLGRDEQGPVRIEAQVLVDLLLDAVDIGGRQIDFVDDRNDLEIVLHGQVEVGQGLGFDPLAGVDQEQRPFAGSQRTRDLVGEIDMTPGCRSGSDRRRPAVGGG